MRSPSLLISLSLHAAAFAALMSAPPIRLPEREKSEYKLAIAGKEEKLIWYKFDKELPDLSPPQPKLSRSPVRTENIAKQEIVASPQNAPPRKQIVILPAPELPDLPPLESPNLIAVKMPAKTFVAPPDVVKPKAVEVQPLPDAPQIAMQPTTLVELPRLAKIQKQFVAPPTHVPLKLKDIAVPVDDAPQLITSVGAPAALDYKMKSPARPFTAPPSRQAATIALPVGVEAPPDIAIVGLNPSANPASLPVASMPAQFSAGPQLRKEGADSAGDAKGLTVPDLFVRGARDPKSELRAMAYAAPTSAATLRESLRLAQPRQAPASTGPPAGVQVSSAPDPRFNGREVYMMAIQMPNLTSYSGSWLMWYADRSAREAGLAPIAPPVAHRKVDPKYIAAAAADRIQGKVQLYCVIGKDGLVSNVEIVKGLEDRLNASAIEAMGKWEFDPATRQGEPVSVDVLVEIPFRLEPRKPVAY